MKKNTLYLIVLIVAMSASSVAQTIRCKVGHPSPRKAPNLSAFTRAQEVVIPVVFHVVYSSPQQNISRTRILDQINVLNDDFNRDNTDIVKVPKQWERRIGKSNIRFCLADKDESGRPHSGIVRVETNIDSIGGRYSIEGQKKLLKNTTLGGSSAWNTNKYLNVWVSDRGDGILGTATFPNQDKIPAEEQGVEIYYRAITGDPDKEYPYRLGRTLTHEIGHYLGLQHLWGSDISCFSEGDGIDDTPRQGKAYFGCPNHPQSSCGSRDMISNFMNFSYDECLNFFTEGQVNYMREILLSERYELVSGGMCDASIPIPPDPFKLSQISQTGYGLVVKLNRLPRIPYTLRLYDMKGQCLWTEKRNYLAIHLIQRSLLSSGIYVLQLSGPNVQVARKVAIIK